MHPNLETLTLSKGAHADREQGLCVMEAVAYIAGEPHSDHPKCASEVITTFMISWNDALPSDEDRARLLRPLIPHLLGTRTTDADDITRSWMAFDWLVRVHTVAWLRLSPTLTVHADALESLEEIRDAASLDKAAPVINAAWDAARAAAWAAAWAAARDAARAAARDAAWDAARAAAWDAARAAARAAAWAAARAAARDAARDAAWDAAWDALKPTTEQLQTSACDLVLRMCAVGKVPSC